VCKLTPDGTVSTLAGSGCLGFADGAGAAAEFYHPTGVAVDGKGSIIITDCGNHIVRKITPVGTVSTLAVFGSRVWDGAGGASESPGGVAVDGEGSIIIADTCNHRVRKITPDGTVSMLAGSGTGGFEDGAGAAAQFNGPCEVAVDGEGSFIIADGGNHRVRKITPDGTVSTLAGSGRDGFADGAGAAAQFNRPIGVAVDAYSDSSYIFTLMYIRTITFVYLFRMFTYFDDIEKNRSFDTRFQKHYKIHLNRAVENRRVAWESVGLSINARWERDKMIWWAENALTNLPHRNADKWKGFVKSDKLMKQAHFLVKIGTTERIAREVQMMDSLPRVYFDIWRAAFKKSV
jgi:hypothetical protein